MAEAGVASYLDLKTHVTDRSGHDRRYAVDASKARRELGFAARHGSREALEAYQAWRHPRSARRPVEVTA